MDLQDWANWAAIVGTAVTVIGAILGLLGKWRFRLPSGLNSFEARVAFVISIAVVPLPFLAWGPPWGLLLSVANFMIFPWLPGYLERKKKVIPRGATVQEALPGTLFWTIILLVIVNFVAFASAWFPEANIGSYEVRNRINEAPDCGAADREFELAFENYKRVQKLHDEARMNEEQEYMRLAERRMRQLSCPQTATLPST